MSMGQLKMRIRSNVYDFYLFYFEFNTKK